VVDRECTWECLSWFHERGFGNARELHKELPTMYMKLKASYTSLQCTPSLLSFVHEQFDKINL